MSDNKIKVITIAGPTASGKTALSVKLAGELDGEIISADSMQIYKGMNIATAKPTKEEMCGVKHHLLDFLDPSELYSVARFVVDANRAVDLIMAENKLPIIVGGTGLYIDSLLMGLSFCEGDTDLELRAKLQAELEENGIDYMLNKLSAVDVYSAERLSVERNPKRIIRALEVYLTTGKTLTEQNELSKRCASRFEAVKLAINFRDREKLYQRINRRVDLMLQMGLLSEAESFYSKHSGDTSIQAIGYKELKPYLDGEKSLDECVETLKRSTRRYAKRQLTWFARDKDIKWFYADEYSSADEMYSEVKDYLAKKGFEFR
ncbi:MAG: tRNA (adenosine(37)-N6)-dimethylallyltransferase MiaA [Ruminococcus sp.]